MVYETKTVILTDKISTALLPCICATKACGCMHTLYTLFWESSHTVQSYMEHDSWLTVYCGLILVR